MIKCQDKQIEKLLKFIPSKTMKDYLYEVEFSLSLEQVIATVDNSYCDSDEKIEFFEYIKQNFTLSEKEMQTVNKLYKKYEKEDAQDEDEWEIRWINIKDYPERMYVEFPIPFKNGDVVKSFDSDEKYIILSTKLPDEKIINTCDWFDFTAYLLPLDVFESEEYKNNPTETKSRFHEHLHFLCIEFA